MNRKKILICVDKIKDLNSGLGRVSIEFAKELMNSDEFEYTYLVPAKYEGDDFIGCKTIKLNLFRKFFSGYMRQFDLVHLLYQSPNYKFKWAKKVLMTIHDINFIHVKSDSKKIKYSNRMQKALDLSDALCYISQFSKEDTNQHLSIYKEKPQKVIYNGVALEDVEAQKPEWSPDKFLFSIGIFTEKKNFHTLIPFIKKLPDDLVLVIAGNSETSYGNKVKEEIAKANLNHRVVLPGLISEAEKSYLYSACQAFVFPSIAEGFGLPVIEAMRVGKPVFCSDRTSLKEIGSSFAYFWYSFDADKMVDVFNEGMSHFTKEQEKSEIDYAHSFTWKRNVTHYIEYYKELLDE